MREKIFENLKLNLILTLSSGVLGFFVNSYFASYMGTDKLGLMKLFTQIVSYLCLVDLGISNASTYALYKPLAEKNILKLNITLSTIDYFYKRISLYILGLGIVLAFFLHFFIKVSNYGNIIYVYWFLYVINTVVGYLFAKYSILFTANQEYGYVRKIQGTGRIIFQLMQILFLIKIQSFSLFITIIILENLYNYYFYSIHYQKYYSYIKKVKTRNIDIIKDMKNLFWHKVGGVVVYNTDYIILVKYTSLSLVGIYSSYLMIYQIVMTIMNILTSVLIPKIGIFVAQNSKNEIYKYWKKLYTLYVLISTIFIICTYKLILPFVKLWLGDNFLLPQLTVTLILINLFISLTRGITDVFKESYGFFDDTYTPILESILNLFFSLILVRKLGLDGVIIGTIVSNVIIIFFLKPILVFIRCFNKKMLNYLKDMTELSLLLGISIFIVNHILKNVFIIGLTGISNWYEFVYKSIILFLVTGITVIVIFLFNNNFRSLIKEIVVSYKNRKMG